MKQLFFVPLLIIIALIPLKSYAGVSMGFDSVKWKLERIYTDSVEMNTAEMKSFILFDRENGRVSGNGGCNNFGGSYLVVGDSLRISRVYSTKMFCSQGQGAEDAYFRVLQRVNRFEMVGDHLNLYNNRDLLLSFSKAEQQRSS